MLQLTESGRPQPPVLRIGFWLMEAFDLYALANALEPLRLANQLAGRSVCQWQILSLDGQQLNASNGIATATARLDQAQTLDVLILCGGDNPPLQTDLRIAPAAAPLGRAAGRPRAHWARPVGCWRRWAPWRVSAAACRSLSLHWRLLLSAS